MTNNHVKTNLHWPFSIAIVVCSALFLLGAVDSVQAQWGTSGTTNIINTNTGNVGIGTADPANAKLQVNKSIRIDDDSTSPTGSDTFTLAPYLYLGTSHGGGAFQFNGAGGLDLWHFNNNTWTRNFTFTKTGLFGIGTNAPEARFHVKSASTIAGEGLFKLQNSAGGALITMGDDTLEGYRGQLSIYGKQSGANYERLRIWHTGDSNDAIVFASEAGGTGTQRNIRFSAPTTMFSGIFNARSGFINSGTGSANYISFGETNVAFNGAIGFDAGSTNMVFQTGGSGILNGITRMTIAANGNVGIGQPSPNAKLDVSGTINATGLTVNGTAVASSQWATSGSTINYATGNVGIGTATPGTLNGTSFSTVGLHVKGTGASKYIAVDDASNVGFLLNDSSQAANSRMWMMLNQSTRFSISKSNDAGTPTEVLSVLRSGNVGIGTTTPGTSLDVSGNTMTVGSESGNAGRANNTTKLARFAMPSYAAASLPFALLGGATTSTANIAAIGGEAGGMSAATQIDFVTAATNNVDTGTVRMTVNSAGNVGIGTASPSLALDVVNSVAAGTGTARFKNTTANTQVILDSVASQNVSLRLDNGGNPVWYIGNSANNDRLRVLNSNANSNAEALTILQSGNVGVGTVSPTAKLDVNGTVNASGLTVNGSAVTSSQWATSGTNINYGSGNVGIGTASPTVKLDVNGTVNATGLTVNGSAVTSSQWATSGTTINYASGNVGIGVSSPTDRLHLNGNVTNGGGITIDNSGNSKFRIGTAGSAVPNWSGHLMNTKYDPAAGTWILDDPSLNAAFLKFDSRPQLYGNEIAFYRVLAGSNPRPDTAATPMLQMRLDTGNIWLAPASGNVGIGTTAPTVKLDVNGTVNATGLTVNGSAVTSSQWATSGATINFGSGNVGIGTTSPTAKLDVNGTVNATGLTVNGAAVTGSQWATSGTTINYGSGNVGIGNSAPSTKLQVAGGTRVDGTSGRVYLGTNAVAGARGLEIIEENATTFSIRHHDPSVAWQNIALNPYGGPTGGFVGIGTLAPTAKLHVDGSAKITGSLTVDGNIAAKYQDVAEWVNTSQALTSGTVVVLDQTRSNQVIASSVAYDTRVAGVISAQPGIALGEGGAGKVLVATTGRVRIKVDASSGAIHIGDLLVTSDKEGVAMKSQPLNIGGAQIHRPGTLIGKALENLESGTGEMLVLLSLQ